MRFKFDVNKTDKDYTDFVVHIFDKESRSFYNLENLWKDATEIDISDFIE